MQQPDLTAVFLELIRRTATDLPDDVEKAIRDAREREAPGSAAQSAFSTPRCRTYTPIAVLASGSAKAEFARMMAKSATPASMQRSHVTVDGVNPVRRSSR